MEQETDNFVSDLGFRPDPDVLHQSYLYMQKSRLIYTQMMNDAIQEYKEG